MTWSAASSPWDTSVCLFLVLCHSDAGPTKRGEKDPRVPRRGKNACRPPCQTSASAHLRRPPDLGFLVEDLPVFKVFPKKQI